MTRGLRLHDSFWPMSRLLLMAAAIIALRGSLTSAQALEDRFSHAYHERSLLGANDVCNDVLGLCLVPANEAVFGMVHNAMSSPQNGFIIFPNHLNKAISLSLDSGYRALSLDLCNCDGEGLQFCHGGKEVQCGIGRLDPMEGLRGVDAWLNEHPNDLVILQLQINEDAGGPIYMKDVLSIIPEGLSKKFYEHTPGTPWPTIGELVSSGTQVIFFHFNGRKDEGPPPPGYMYFYDYAIETEWSHHTVESLETQTCQIDRGGDSTKEWFMQNNFVSVEIIFGAFVPSATVARQVNEKDFFAPLVDRCSSIQGKQVNLISVDFWNIGNLPAYISEENAVIAAAFAPAPTDPPTPGPMTSAPSSAAHESSPPSNIPSLRPSHTSYLSSSPVATISNQPSITPSSNPSEAQSDTPAKSPSAIPSNAPSNVLSLLPSDGPLNISSGPPSSVPSSSPSRSLPPSVAPSTDPTTATSFAPSSEPSYSPLADPSSPLSKEPSKSPSSNPSKLPSHPPSSNPSAAPSSSTAPTPRPVDLEMDDIIPPTPSPMAIENFALPTSSPTVVTDLSPPTFPPTTDTPDRNEGETESGPNVFNGVSETEGGSSGSIVYAGSFCWLIIPIVLLVVQML